MSCLRPWDGRVVERMLEDVDFGLVDDAELGQQVYQVSVQGRVGGGIHQDGE